MTRQMVSSSLKAIAGAILISVGLVILFGNLDAVTASLSKSAGLSSNENLNGLLAIGLAGVEALQAYSLDPSGFSAGLLKNLLSFWPLILVISGGALLQSAFARRLTNYEIWLTLPERRNESMSLHNGGAHRRNARRIP